MMIPFYWLCDMYLFIIVMFLNIEIFTYLLYIPILYPEMLTKTVYLYNVVGDFLEFFIFIN